MIVWIIVYATMPNVPFIIHLLMMRLLIMKKLVFLAESKMENAVVGWGVNTRDSLVLTIATVRLLMKRVRLKGMGLAHVDTMQVAYFCGIKISGAFSYCPLSTGDVEFSEMTRSLRFIVARNTGCHTLRRHGPCSLLYDDEYNDYHYKLRKY